LLLLVSVAGLFGFS